MTEAAQEQVGCGGQFVYQSELDPDRVASNQAPEELRRRQAAHPVAHEDQPEIARGVVEPAQADRHRCSGRSRSTAVARPPSLAGSRPRQAPVRWHRRRRGRAAAPCRVLPGRHPDYGHYGGTVDHSDPADPVRHRGLARCHPGQLGQGQRNPQGSQSPTVPYQGGEHSGQPSRRVVSTVSICCSQSGRAACDCASSRRRRRYSGISPSHRRSE